MILALPLRAAVIAAALFAAPQLIAQTNEAEVPVKPAPPTLDPKACADGDRLREGDTVGTDGRAPQTDEPLSEKLARTDGVICPPPGLDPHIRAPAPGGRSDMPVIPPPGSPGGSPEVQPK